MRLHRACRCLWGEAGGRPTNTPQECWPPPASSPLPRSSPASSSHVRTRMSVSSSAWSIKKGLKKTRTAKTRSDFGGQSRRSGRGSECGRGKADRIRGPVGRGCTWVTGLEWRLVPKASTVSERPVRNQRAAPSRARLPPRPVVPPSAVPLTLPSSPRGARRPRRSSAVCILAGGGLVNVSVKELKAVDPGGGRASSQGESGALVPKPALPRGVLGTSVGTECVELVQMSATW